MSVEGFTCAPEGIIHVYCCVDDIRQTIVKQRLRGRGFMPKLSDAEAITMEIVGKFMGKDHDKGIWRYFRNHWHGWFPNLGSRANFAKQSALVPRAGKLMGVEKAHTGSHGLANRGDRRPRPLG